MNRKKFLQIITLSTSGGVLFGVDSLLQSCNSNNMGMGNMDMNMNGNTNIIEGTFENILSFPETHSSPLTLTAQFVQSSMGELNGLGYHSDRILGPTLLANKGDSINIRFVNSLTEPSNIHWHGLMIPSDMDGHPSDVITSGNSFTYTFIANQRAGLYWYHPHPDAFTAKQVYRGLAGLLVIRDSEESSLALPAGEREVFMVIQDKDIANGTVQYSPSMMQQMSGLLGKYVFVNGAYSPRYFVKNGKYRLRILNGSNARIYNIAFSNNMPFSVIGSDGGLLPDAVSVNEVLLAPGERIDIIADFAQIGLNNNVFLLSKMFSSGGSQGKQQYNIIKFVVNAEANDNTNVPNHLSDIQKLDTATSLTNRYFTITSGMMMQHTINNKTYDMNRIDAVVKSNSVEVWIFDNTNGSEPHPIHLHGAMFQVVERSGGRGMVFPHEYGWKDTILCLSGEKVKILVQFGEYKGTYVFHCHNLEHEDAGMMLQYKIT
ncbi:MAG: multicopper oxidase domain-containing protein [Candidatus Kapaibacterium sp.]|nr:multicopper oxidase domain-containing protein [Bacteroidota bacterium]